MNAAGKRITVVKWDTGDWVALYVDNNFYEEGHSLDEFHWVKAINEHGPIASAVELTLTAEKSDTETYDDAYTSAPTYLNDFSESDFKP
jgi:hypothetical protein